MPEAPQLNVEMSEADRRRLVAGIAEQGSRARKATTQTKKQGADFSAAAAAAVRGGPVDLSTGQQGQLSSRTDAAVASGDRFADAQSALFADARASAQTTGNKFYDDTQTTVGATNLELQRYQKELEDAEAARLAGRRGGGGRGGDAPWSPGDDGPLTEDGVWRSPTNPLGLGEGVVRPLFESENQPLYEGGNEAMAANDSATARADDIVFDEFEAGRTWEQAMAAAWRSLTANPDISPDIARQIMDGISQNWYNTFPDSSELGRGPTASRNPGAQGRAETRRRNSTNQRRGTYGSQTRTGPT